MRTLQSSSGSTLAAFLTVKFVLIVLSSGAITLLHM